MQSTHTGEVYQLQMLPPAARSADLFPALGNTCLLSLGKLADAGCIIILKKDQLVVKHKGKVILTGYRCPYTGLWMVPLKASPTAPSCNSTTTQHLALSTIYQESIPEQVAFSHAALFSPNMHQVQKAFENNFLLNFPGFNKSSIKKYAPHTVATAKGHMDQSRANQKSTRNPKTSQDEFETDFFTIEPLPNGEKTNLCFVSIMDLPNPQGQVFTDQTGRFPITSASGMKYIFVCYAYDSNTIFPVPIKNREAQSILDAYKKVHNKLVKAGIRPKLHRLDNECSQLFKDFMLEEAEDYQLVPPGIHRRNAAERAIRTWKNHFIAGLSSVDPNFPLTLWDLLVEQSYITLNLLRPSRMNPKLSAYTQIEGEFDYLKTPIAPPGIRVLVHEKPSKRGSFAPHGVDGWYTGPAMEHYRCFKTYIWKSKAERITDTLEWFPHYVKMPKISDLDLLLSATSDILQVLNNPQHNGPISPLADSEREKLKTVTEILHKQLSQSESEKSPQAPTAPVLRVPANTTATPALRVPEKLPLQLF